MSTSARAETAFVTELKGTCWLVYREQVRPCYPASRYMLTRKSTVRKRQVLATFNLFRYVSISAEVVQSSPALGVPSPRPSCSWPASAAIIKPRRERSCLVKPQKSSADECKC
jgi:hypothetical protein